jgi:amino acid transporter
MAEDVVEPEVLVRSGLIKSMRWYDGFVVCLSASGFMLSTLGYAIGALGAWGALALWTVSAVLGAVQTYIFVEPAMMYGDSSGGLAAYSREAWRRRANILSPLGGFAYWIAYTSTLSSFALIAAQLVQAQWFSSQTWVLHVGVNVGFSQVLAVALIVLVWTINTRGMSPTRLFGYVTGVLFVVVLLVFAFVPYASGHFNSHLLTWGIGQPGQEWGGWRIALAYLYLMGWSSYPTEQAATFAPEYIDTLPDTRKGLLSSAAFTLGVFILVPLGLGGVMSSGDIGANPISFYVTSLEKMIGSAGSGLAVILLVVACLLTMNASTMNASRALYATSKRGYTLRLFGKLNKHRVPANAMTFDMLVNSAVVLLLNSVIGIVAASNMAYFVVVILTLSGVVLLRRDQPDHPRPVKLSPVWIALAVVMTLIDIVLLVVGSTSFQLTGYGGWNIFFVGLGAILLGIVFYFWRVIVEDKRPIMWRDQREFVAFDEDAIP